MASARLVLADGSVFHGEAVGAVGTATGEAVFNTGMTGYQEVLSDPSYTGQIVTMTYPEIGNYGIIREDMESNAGKVAGFVMRRCCHTPSNFRSDLSLPDFLSEQGIVGIAEVDTRAITRRLRVDGAMPAVISSEVDKSDDELIDLAKNLPSMAGTDLASAAGTAEVQAWDQAINTDEFGADVDWPRLDNLTVVAIDLGIKHNILRLLRSCGAEVELVPANTPAADILARKPAGIFVSNGPGDPAVLEQAVATITELIPSGIPMFGICLGHQIISLASGAKTFKLKFGHRGSNHPIQRLSDGAVEIASHNHGFAVDKDSLPECLELTHVNLNDNTCAGVKRTDYPVFSVQYHPEACPGPSDPLYLFKQFTELIQAHN